MQELLELASAVFTEADLIKMGPTKEDYKYFADNFHYQLIEQINERNAIKKHIAEASKPYPPMIEYGGLYYILTGFLEEVEKGKINPPYDYIKKLKEEHPLLMIESKGKLYQMSEFVTAWKSKQAKPSGKFIEKLMKAYPAFESWWLYRSRVFCGKRSNF